VSPSSHHLSQGAPQHLLPPGTLCPPSWLVRGATSFLHTSTGCTLALTEDASLAFWVAREVVGFMHFSIGVFPALSSRGSIMADSIRAVTQPSTSWRRGCLTHLLGGGAVTGASPFLQIFVVGGSASTNAGDATTALWVATGAAASLLRVPQHPLLWGVPRPIFFWWVDQRPQPMGTL
jgi:hypothetical protein